LTSFVKRSRHLVHATYHWPFASPLSLPCVDQINVANVRGLNTHARVNVVNKTIHFRYTCDIS